MRWPIIAMVVLVVVGAGALLLYMTKESSSDETACREQMPKIVAFGDSLVAGYGATTGNDFVSVLSREIGVPIENLGRNGETSASAQSRIAEVVTKRPDIVILLVGGNDALQRTSVETTTQNLDSILTTLTQGSSQKIHVVLVGVLGGPLQDPYRPMFEQLAKKHDVAYVPNILSGIFGNRELLSDQIHPNDAGYAKIAARLTPVVRAACEVALGAR